MDSTGIRKRTNLDLSNIDNNSNGIDPTEINNSSSSSSLNQSTSSGSNYQSDLQQVRNLMRERIKSQQKQDGTFEEEVEESSTAKEEDSTNYSNSNSKEQQRLFRRGSDDEIVRDMLLPINSTVDSNGMEKSAKGSSTSYRFSKNNDSIIPPLCSTSQEKQQQTDFHPAPTNLPGEFPTPIEEFMPPPPAAAAAAAAAPRPIPTEGGGGGEKMCRICFDGEVDDESGALFSPCICRGTSRYVHVTCLTRWRKASVGATSFYRCDQCGYEYRISRSNVAGLATNRYALGVVTFFFFALLIFLAGFIATGMIEAVQSRQARSVFDDYWISDYTIMSESISEAVNFFGVSLEKTTGLKTIPTTASYTTYPTGFFSYFSRPKTHFINIDGSSTLLTRTIQHFIKGFSFVGIISFFQTIFASSALGIFGLRGTLFRAVRPNRRNGDNQVSLSQLVIVAFVVVGTYKTVIKLYSLVEWGSKKVLKRVEGLVMDVGTRDI